MTEQTKVVDLPTSYNPEGQSEIAISNPTDCCWRGYSPRQYDSFGWEIHRDCDVCQTGKRWIKDEVYADVSRCHQKIVYQDLITQSGLMGKEISHTFENAIIDNHNQRLYQMLQNWMPDKGGVYITAGKSKDNPQGNGTGKSYALHALTHRLCRVGINCLYARTIDFLTELKKAYEGDNQKNETRVLRKYKDVDVLLWDDLGKEYMKTEWGPGNFYHVIDYRDRMGLPVIISSNFNLDELIGRFDENFGSAIASRIAGMCETYSLGGPDRRLTRG